VTESQALVSAFVHGVAAGAMCVTALAIWRSTLGVHVRTAGVLAGVSIFAWLITESPELCAALGGALPLIVVAYPVAALFWLFVLTVFDDWRVTPLTLAPAAALLATGFAMAATGPPATDVFWGARNLFAALLALHAGLVVLRGWRGDLVEGRRRFRALLLALACLYVVLEVTVAFLNRLDPGGPWLMVAVGRPYGGAIVSLLILALGLMALQPRAAVFGASRRVEPAVDSRAEAMDRATLSELEALMASEGWRREGLAIGDLAGQLGVPEHRLRRLINQRLGYRNFADFLNGYRIEAAKRRLADPGEARVTVAAIAFELGYGSLGPFNRAFRAATGATPTEWRRRALADALPELKEAV
jgi:AraC-like DNA-binding protein